MQINKTVERVIQKVTTQNGEITVNLNLNITVDGILKGIQVTPEMSLEKLEDAQKKKEFVPEEMFELEIPVLSNFGK